MNIFLEGKWYILRVEWMSLENGRFSYAAQTHLSHDTEMRTVLRAFVLAYSVPSLAAERFGLLILALIYIQMCQIPGVSLS
jgi:hypothetical protein